MKKRKNTYSLILLRNIKSPEPNTSKWNLAENNTIIGKQ